MTDHGKPDNFRDHSLRRAMPSRELKHGRAITNDQEVSLHRDDALVSIRVGAPVPPLPGM